MKDPANATLTLVTGLATVGGLAAAVYGIFQFMPRWLHRLASRTDLTDAERKPREDAVVTGALSLTLLAGALACTAGALASSENIANGRMFEALMIAIGCVASGGLVGFLFGIPRVSDSKGAGGDGQKRTFQPSTSLDQVADWLTKIFVGLSLVETNKISGHITRAVTFFGKELGPPDQPREGLAAAILMFYPILGFVGCYLITRLYLVGAIGRADSDAASIFERLDVKPLQAEDARARVVRELCTMLLGQNAGPGGTSLALSQEAQSLVSKMNSVDFHELKSPEELLTWGLAMLWQNKPDAALPALTHAEEQDPASAETSFARAVAMSKVKMPPASVINELKAAARKVTDKTASAVSADIFNALTTLLLYNNGADDVITLLSERKDILAADPSGALHLNLACAYGQKAKALTAEETSPVNSQSKDNFKDLEAKAANAVAEALRRDSRWRPRVELLVSKEHPDKRNNPSLRDEDDLVVFAGCPEFKPFVKYDDL